MAASCALALGFLTIYGANSWFFPSDHFARIAALPVVGLGLYCAFYLCRRAPPVVPTTKSHMRKPFFCIAIAGFIPLIFWCIFVFGIPALVMRMQGPNGALLATIYQKGTGTRTCRYKLKLRERSTFLKEELCVDRELFDAFSEGQRVRLTVREGFFGTRVFTIAGANKALQSTRETRAPES